MTFFNGLFGGKDNTVGIAARKKAIEDFESKLKLLKITSFELRVGDDDGNNTDTLFILSSHANNPDVNGFLQHSLLKSHTAKNLMSIGFNRIGIVVEGGDEIKIATLSKYV